MSNYDVFDFRVDIHGARVVVIREPLMPNCLTDGEIDGHIKRVKDELDAVSMKMKAALHLRAVIPLDDIRG